MPVWGVPGASGTFWTQIASITISGSSASGITFSNLNGNMDQMYRIVCFWVSDGTMVTVTLQVNGDTTAADYDFQDVVGTNGASQASYNTLAGLLLGISATTAGQALLIEGILYATTGTPRVLGAYGGGIDTAAVTSFASTAISKWINTSANITSLTVTAASGGTHMAVGSRCDLYALRTF